jgi:hypothetical protein
MSELRRLNSAEIVIRILDIICGTQYLDHEFKKQGKNHVPDDDEHDIHDYGACRSHPYTLGTAMHT